MNENKRITKFDKSVYQQILTGNLINKNIETTSTGKLAHFSSILSVNSEDNSFESANKKLTNDFTQEEAESFLKQNSLSYLIRNDPKLKCEPFSVNNKVISLRGLDSLNNKDKSSSGYVLITDERLQMVLFE